jgi:hypothetical protein
MPSVAAVPTTPVAAMAAMSRQVAATTCSPAKASGLSQGLGHAPRNSSRRHLAIACRVRSWPSATIRAARRNCDQGVINRIWAVNTLLLDTVGLPRGPKHEQTGPRGKEETAAESAALYSASASAVIAALPPQRQSGSQIIPPKAAMQFESSWQDLS